MSFRACGEPGANRAAAAPVGSDGRAGCADRRRTRACRGRRRSAIRVWWRARANEGHGTGGGAAAGPEKTPAVQPPCALRLSLVVTPLIERWWPSRRRARRSRAGSSHSHDHDRSRRDAAVRPTESSRRCEIAARGAPGAAIQGERAAAFRRRIRENWRCGECKRPRAIELGEPRAISLLTSPTSRTATRRSHWSVSSWTGSLGCLPLLRSPCTRRSRGRAHGRPAG